ncbi:MAG: polysaccharide deacetylase family protein [Desulfobacterales bacterium]|jgi:peptidoglycan/xylan/chitin deacetylase (PgdA/CDA1 family)
MAIDLNKLVKGIYEANVLNETLTGDTSVPDFAFNILNTMGLLYTPVVDENYLSHDGKRPVWPNTNAFAVCLTHDVDEVSLYSYRQSLRGIQRPPKNSRLRFHSIRKAFGLGLNTIRITKNLFNKDPLHCYERWLEIEKAYDAKSTFFFWPGWRNVTKHHHSDSTYELDDCVVFDRQKCTVTEMIQEIHRRDWEIGLHPSWYAFNDVDELKRQKEALETALESSVHSVRQHYLHYDIRNTPRVHSEAGFKYDSTLGFNDNIGFRFGTCYPWNLYDLKADQKLPIVEIPLIVQDVAMLSPNKGLRLNWEMALDYIVLMTERVNQVGGVLTLLWHTNEIINLESLRVYKKSLEYLKRQNCWMTTVRQVGDWWTQRSKTI